MVMVRPVIALDGRSSARLPVGGGHDTAQWVEESDVMGRRVQRVREASVDLQWKRVVIAGAHGNAPDDRRQLFERFERDGVGSVHSVEGAVDRRQQSEWVERVACDGNESAGTRGGWVEQFQESGNEQCVTREGVSLAEECGDRRRLLCGFWHD